MDTKDFDEAVSHAAKTVKYLVPTSDIGQETLASLLAGGHDLATVDRALVFTVAKRRAIDMVRKTRRETSVGFQAARGADMGAAIMRTRPSKRGNPAEEWEADQLEQGIDNRANTLLDRLSGAQRDIAEAYYLEGLDANEIAERSGYTPTNVRQTLYQARKRLGQEAVDDLAILRKYWHPNAKTGKGTPTPSPQLLALIQ